MTAPVQVDLRRAIENHIVNDPRSLQKLIGPSGIGTPCLRKLAHRLAQTPEVNPQIAWRATVGKACHKWAESALRADNERLGRERWLIETRVPAGPIGPEEIEGNSDVFDLDTGTVIDWKFPGVTTIRSARKAKYPGVEYQVQSHIYGSGYAVMGFEVKTVAVYFLPAAGELSDGYYWSEPYNPQVAANAMARANKVDQTLRALGPAVVMPVLPTAPDHCEYCPWWVPKTTNLARACPGDVGMEIRPDRKQELQPFTPVAV